MFLLGIFSFIDDLFEAQDDHSYRGLKGQSLSTSVLSATEVLHRAAGVRRRAGLNHCFVKIAIKRRA